MTTHIESAVALLESGWAGDAINLAAQLGVAGRTARRLMQTLAYAGIATLTGRGGIGGAKRYRRSDTPLPERLPVLCRQRRSRAGRRRKAANDAPSAPSAPNVPLVRRALDRRPELIAAWWPIGEAA